MKITVEKYHSLGNDYFVYDPEKNELPLNESNVKLICSRNLGMGADGIVEGPILKDGAITVRIWNSDGSIAKKSGNGLQIFAKYLKDAGYVQKKKVRIETLGGAVNATYLNETGSRLTVSMGKLSFLSDDIPVRGERREVVNETMIFGKIPYKVTCVSVGNPHCVIFLNDISKEVVCKIGEYSENAEYFPEKMNTLIMNVLDRTHIQIEIYERGSGYTLSSGSSCCAAAGVAYRMGLADSKTYVQMPGGTLEVDVKEDGTIFMTGMVEYIGRASCDGQYLSSHDSHI